MRSSALSPDNPNQVFFASLLETTQRQPSFWRRVFLYLLKGVIKPFGVCRLPPPGFDLNSDVSDLNALKKILSKAHLDDLEVIDRHGGVLSSTIKRKEQHVIGRIIGVGDAVSTANLLGGEGIRHAMLSAEILAPLLIDSSNSLSTNKERYISPLNKYETLLRRGLGWRWVATSRIAKKVWWGLSNESADKRLTLLIKKLSEKASADEISALLFDYRFERYGLKLLPYLLGWQ